MSQFLQSMKPYSAPSMLGAAVVGGLGLLWLLRKLRVKRALDTLQGKVVLITGASSGIGEACAYAYYRAGCRVIISARRLEELERVKREIVAQSMKDRPTYEPQILQMDVADFATVSECIKKAITFHGRIDVLVNNAGLSYRGVAVETKMEVHQRVMLVNYFGSVAVTTALLPHMISNKSGSIVAVSSIQGKMAIPFRTAYTASKHAMQAYFDSLRAEVAHHNIHVGVISPGYVHTNLSINAVTADNSQYGVMDPGTASGMSAGALADRTVLLTAQKEADVVVGPAVHCFAANYLKPLFPSLLRWYLRQQAKNGLKKSSQ